MLIEFSDIELAVISMATSAAGATANTPGNVMPAEMVAGMRTHHHVLYEVCKRVTEMVGERAAFIQAQRDVVAQADKMRGKPE